MLQQHKSLPFWTIVLLGLFYISLRCDARAVNVSNTWTMPQEGLNVFYRFFRDRISWFEADAVCQFHHANLVTVDNSFQFDATRDLLRELDVNDIVWIGLMRPQNSDRFMWSNSRPLVTDTGYWAESLPLMDAPLCAVIDPIRDYRWHALRCGGPETASFLCEMPVPAWADACILKDMPNLTMQYMADTASIELIRNCQEEGLLRQTCKGKEDRELAIQQLICPKERLEAQRINDITNSHFKSLQIINSIRTDNNENNDIELLPMLPNYGGGGSGGSVNLERESYDGGQSSLATAAVAATEQNTVQRLIEQFNVDELMQADEPPVVISYRIPDEIPKPVKKAAKKVEINIEFAKKMQKTQQQQQQRREQQQQAKEEKAKKMFALEDMMMGDQPQQQQKQYGEPELIEHSREDDQDVSNEIMELLPHRKKILPQDLKTMPPLLELSGDHSRSTTTAPATTTSTTTATTTTTTTTAAPTTTTSAPTTTTAAATTTTIVAATIAVNTDDTDSDNEQNSNIGTAAASDASVTTMNLAHQVTTQPPATIGHPMHPQQPRSNVIVTEETQHPHIKESADNSHFIPPMLLVKSHYVPPAKHDHEMHHAQVTPHHEQPSHEQHQHQQPHEPATTMAHEAATTIIDITEAVTISSTSTSIKDTQSQIIDSATKQWQSSNDEKLLEKKGPTERITKLKSISIKVDGHNATNNMLSIELNTPTITTMATTTAASATTTATKQLSETTPTAAEVEAEVVNVEDNNEKSTMKTAKIQLTTTTTTSTAKPITTKSAMKDKAKPIIRTTTNAYAPASAATATATATVTTANGIEHVDTSAATTTIAKSDLLTGTATTATTTTTSSAIMSSRRKAEVAEKMQTGISATSTAVKPEAIVETASDVPAATTVAVAATTTTATTTTTTAATVPMITTTTQIIHATTPTATEIDEDETDNNNNNSSDFVATANNMPNMTTAKTTITPSSSTSTSAPPDSETEATTERRDFLKEETETPYKPNRRRSLTKPETVSYFKKILG